MNVYEKKSDYIAKKWQVVVKLYCQFILNISQMLKFTFTEPVTGM